MGKLEINEEELTYFFKERLSKSNFEDLVSRVVAFVRCHEQEEIKKISYSDSIKKAERKIDSAIKDLDKVKIGEGIHLKNALLKVKSEIGYPTEKESTLLSFIELKDNFENFEEYSKEVTRNTNISNEAGLMFSLASFWKKEFGEEPTNKRKEDNFFTFLGILLGIDSASAYRSWNRNIK